MKKKRRLSTRAVFDALAARRFFNWVPDKYFIKIQYRIARKKKLDFNNVQTLNEKLQWLKLYNRNPEFTKMVDKIAVKEYVSNMIGEQYIIPTLGVWENFEDIPFEELPDQFVLKCNHDSGGLVVCKDKSKLNIKEARKKINKSLKRNFYNGTREWPYKNVKPLIFCEKYMVDESGYELKDYKFYCFDGKVKFLMVSSDRQSSKETCAAYFDENFVPLDFTWGYKQPEVLPSKPKDFDEMISLAEKLSRGMVHVRIDLYNTLSGIYFGEITFYDGSGLDPIIPSEWDEKLGSYICLDRISSRHE